MRGAMRSSFLETGTTTALRGMAARFAQYQDAVEGFKKHGDMASFKPVTEALDALNDETKRHRQPTQDEAAHHTSKRTIEGRKGSRKRHCSEEPSR